MTGCPTLRSFTAKGGMNTARTPVILSLERSKGMNPCISLQDAKGISQIVLKTKNPIRRWGFYKIMPAIT